ncbi:hypothetical protein NC651_023502 [Populus alba x Populus x berolinensis]|nr:hypothetical protein NC651_023502 [Populus alba x Populus x berolinensis]
MITSLPLPFLHFPCSRASHVKTILSPISSSTSPLTNNVSALPSPTLPRYSGSRIPPRRLSLIMSSAISRPVPIELRDDSDFRSFLSSSDSDLISVCGFGSLLSERSARSTFPDLLNFRVARLNGFRRVFAHVAPIFFERGIAKPETKEISSLSVEPCEGESLVVTVFEIEKSELDSSFYGEGARVSIFSYFVQISSIYFALFTSGRLCLKHWMASRLIFLRCFVRVIVMKSFSKLDAKMGLLYLLANFMQEVRRFIFSIMEDITSIRSGEMTSYLVVLIFVTAKNLSDAAYNNFLEHTFLGDRKTTIREYLATTGAGIMEEEPPESLKTRYGG